MSLRYYKCKRCGYDEQNTFLLVTSGGNKSVSLLGYQCPQCGTTVDAALIDELKGRDLVWAARIGRYKNVVLGQEEKY